MMILPTLIILAHSEEDWNLGIQDARTLLDSLDQIERGLKEHSSDFDEFSRKYNFLISNDQKLRNRINIMQNADKVKSPDRDVIEIGCEISNNFDPITNFYYINTGSSMFTRLKSILHKDAFVIKPKEKSAAAQIDFDEVSNDSDCLVKEFRMRFVNSEHESEAGIFHFAKQLEKQSFQLPTHVFFDEIHIIPETNWGNQTFVCLPRMHILGEKGFNMH